MSTVQQMLQLMKSQESYKNLKQFTERILRNDHSVFEPICTAIKEAQKLRDPMQCLMASRLAKDTVETKNQEFIEVFQNIVLPVFEKIGEFRNNDQNEDRGKYYFSDTPDKNQSSYGNSLLRLVLEGICAWARQYPLKNDQPTQFYSTYARLKLKKIKFPRFQYFKAEEVNKNTSAQFQEPTQSSIQMIDQVKPASPQQPIQQQQQQFFQAPEQKQVQPQKSQFAPTPTPNPTPQGQIDQQQLHDLSVLRARFNLLKQRMYEEAIKSYTSVNLYVRAIKQVNDEFLELVRQIDAELLSQDDDSSIELLNLQDDINEQVKHFERLQKGELTPEEFTESLEQNQFQIKGGKQGKIPQKEGLHPIQEETENSQSSYIGKYFGGNKQSSVQQPYSNVKPSKDSIGLEYNMEQVYSDFQKQLESLRTQHDAELNLKSQEFRLELSIKEKQLNDCIELKDQMSNQIQDLKQKEHRYKEEIENLYYQSQNGLSNHTQAMTELEKANHGLKQRVEALESVSQNSMSENTQLLATIQDLQHQLEEQKAKHQQIFEQQQTLNFVAHKNTASDVNGQITDLVKQSEILQNKLQTQKQIDSTRQLELINEKKKLEQKLQDEKQENQSLTEKIFQLNLQLEQYKRNFQVINEQNIEQNKRIEESLQYKTKAVEDEAIRHKFNQLLQQFQQSEKDKHSLVEKFSKEIKELKQQLQQQKDRQLLTPLLTPTRVSIDQQQQQQGKNQFYLPINTPSNLELVIPSKSQQVLVDNFLPNQFNQTAPMKLNTQKLYSQKSEKQYAVVDILIAGNKNKEPYEGYEHFSNSTKFISCSQSEKRKSAPIILLNETFLYPHSTPQQYYQNKVKKQNGKKITFINTLMNLNLTGKNLLNYKLTHLYRANQLFIDYPDLTVAVDQQVKKVDRDIFINYGIYFKTELGNLKFKAFVKNTINLEGLWISNSDINQSLVKNEQLLVEASLRISPNCIDEVVMLEMNYNNKIQTAYLQKQLLSLLNYHKIDQKLYKKKWKLMRKWRTEEFQFNTQILSDYLDIQRISSCLIITNEDKLNEYLQGVDEIKFVAIVSILHYKIEGILRIELIPENRIILFFGVEERKVTQDHDSVITKILNNLQSLIMSDN